MLENNFYQFHFSLNRVALKYYNKISLLQSIMDIGQLKKNLYQNVIEFFLLLRLYGLISTTMLVFVSLQNFVAFQINAQKRYS